MVQALVNGRALLRSGLRSDLAVVVDGDRIVAIAPEAPGHADIVDLGGHILLPGFIDTQVNGGGGRLLNDDPSVETVAAIAAAHRAHGTTGLLPTLISDELDLVRRAIAAVDAAIEAGVPGVLGIHVEGPFLNPERCGIHDRGRLRGLDDEAVALLASARHGRTLVTLAPECARPGDIRRLVEAGVIVAAGHSAADYETVIRAADEGMTGVTHLFNAMSQLGNRAPGVVGATLDDGRLTAGLIVDGHHLHPAAVRLALRAKGVDRLMLVTDAMSLTGSAGEGFTLQGRAIRRDGDRLVDAAGTLAGSTLTMEAAVRNMVEQSGASLADAVAMASTTPAAFLGLAHERGRIASGLAADLVLVDDDLGVRRTWIAGQSLSA